MRKENLGKKKEDNLAEKPQFLNASTHRLKSVGQTFRDKDLAVHGCPLLRQIIISTV